MNDKDIPELYNEKKDCCGCGACSVTCTVSAIKMEEDDEGFLYPVINTDVCVACKTCVKVCPLKA